MLMLKTITRSKAILGWWKFKKSVKAFIEGQEYEIHFEVTNIGKTLFPGGSLTVIADWPTPRPNPVVFHVPIPSLNSGKTHKTDVKTSGCLSKGFCLFTIVFPLYGPILANDGKPVDLYDLVRKKIRPRYSFHSIKASTEEEKAEVYGLWIAAVSLAILAAEKLILFFNYPLGLLPN